jgi:hypothetical protein
MKYLYWVAAAIVVVIGVGISVYFGQGTVSLPKITYNHYSDPAKFAEVLILKMSSELKDAPLVMLGVAPGRKIGLEIWKAFLDQTASGELKYPVVIVDPGLPFANEMFPDAVKMDLKKDFLRFIEGAKNARVQGVRMAVIVPSIYASQLLQGNPADSIKKNSDLKLTSFSVMGFPRAAEQEATMEIRCVMGQNDRDGEGALGCEAQKKARLLYRKKSRPGFYEGVMDQVGEKDYLVLFNAP